MSIHVMRFSLGIFFLLLAGAIFTRRWLMPGLDEKFDPLRMNLGGAIALMFGGLNLARCYAAWAWRNSMRTPVRYPLQPDPSVVPPTESIPEFDFTRQMEEERAAGEQEGKEKQ